MDDGSPALVFLFTIDNDKLSVSCTGDSAYRNKWNQRNVLAISKINLLRERREVPILSDENDTKLRFDNIYLKIKCNIYTFQVKYTFNSFLIKRYKFKHYFYLPESINYVAY